MNSSKFVEGETLAERIGRGPIPIEHALNIARNICEALEVAHDKGVTHRDLKPANIKLTPDSKVKVLDFGLAKLVAKERSPADSPTLSMAATDAHVILGTAAYMSPEQAQGQPVDRRRDIFAFGCVLYEMLTGRAAFEGEDIAEILGRVATAEPDWAALTALVPPTQYLFGTDYSPEPIESTVNEIPKLGMSRDVLEMLERKNAERLFPRFKV